MIASASLTVMPMSVTGPVAARTMEKAGFVNYPELETISIKEGKEIPTWTLRLILS